MAINSNFKNLIKEELNRVDKAGVSKRSENIIEGFIRKDENSPRQLIKGKPFLIFNSNDYLGLRLNHDVMEAEKNATEMYGAGPGAVRFISGTMKIHRDLEKAIARFHGRDDAMIYSSAFAANASVIHCLIKGQSKDSFVSDNTLVISDELNHRSIIDAIRLANLPKENRAIFRHRNLDDLSSILEVNHGKFKRVLVISDGIFSMLGVYQDLARLNEIVKTHETFFEEGIITIIDDCHGVAAFGKTGRGTEEVCNARCDVLIGTFGKGFGSDGGYVVAQKEIIDYLRESSATYIYSNPISPSVAGAALTAVQIVDSVEGKELLAKLSVNIVYLKENINKLGLKLAAESIHGIQPVLIGDSVKTRSMVDEFYSQQILVTNISYPIVPKGRDEIRVQLCAAHSKKDIDLFLEKLKMISKKLNIC